MIKRTTASEEGEEVQEGQRYAVFMHGLESGPGGSKHRWLEANLHRVQMQVVCPYMHMSIWRPDKANSVLAHAARNLFGGWPSTLIQRAMRSSMDGCLDAQVATLSGNPMLVVASSWGGAIATLALATGAWSGPTVLLAPAYAKAIDTVGGPTTPDRAPQRVYEAIRDRLTEEQRANIIIIHGTEDGTVPFENSVEFAETAGLKLITVDGGDHRLNNFVLDQNNVTKNEEADEPPLLQRVIEQVLSLQFR